MNRDFNITKGTRISDRTTIKHGVYSALLKAAFLNGLVVALRATARAATDSTLATNLSFTDDSSLNFPIEASNLADARIADGRPTAIFVGTSNCWNTARETQRLVPTLSRGSRSGSFCGCRSQARLACTAAACQPLLPRYTPTLAIFHKSGRLVYHRAGETVVKRDTRHLQQLID
jgi:hypothetical protein